MIVSELRVDNLRVLQHLVVKPSPGLNLIVGDNGSGKTSVLEALYLLGYGRSFRHREATPMIRDGQDQARVVARLSGKDSVHTLGLARTAKDFIARFDGDNLGKRSELIKRLPLQWIGPSPQDLITGSPEKRRQFIDQGLFHVEHSYLEVSQRYGRLLGQRNEALRRGMIDTVNTWDAGLALAGEELHQLRKQLIQQLVPGVGSLLNDWGLGVEVEIRYSRGWPENRTLIETLAEGRPRDQKQRFTGAGPHRADLTVKLQTGKAGKRLSRGQLKMSSIALHFALTDILRTQQSIEPLLLIDDLPAELDVGNRERLLASAGNLFPQIFAAALGKGDIPIAPKEMFHVEHGTLV